MVHGLTTLRRLNDEAVEKARRNGHNSHGLSNGVKIPKALELNAAAVRDFINRPWTAKEYGGPTPQETYARGEKKPVPETIRR